MLDELNGNNKPPQLQTKNIKYREGVTYTNLDSRTKKWDQWKDIRKSSKIKFETTHFLAGNTEDNILL